MPLCHLSTCFLADSHNCWQTSSGISSRVRQLSFVKTESSNRADISASLKSGAAGGPGELPDYGWPEGIEELLNGATSLTQTITLENGMVVTRVWTAIYDESGNLIALFYIDTDNATNQVVGYMIQKRIVNINKFNQTRNKKFLIYYTFKWIIALKSPRIE